MPTPIICAKSEDLDSVEKRKNYTTCIIGCGQNGLLQAVLFADAGFRVICYDSDQTVINNLLKGRANWLDDETEKKLKGHIKNNRITVADDLKEAVLQCGIVVVSVSARLDSKKKVDYSSLENLYKKIGQSIRTGSLVIVTKLEGIGVFEGVIKENLENASGFKIGTDIAVAYSPFHYSSLQRVVSSSDKNSLDVASTVIGLVSKGAIKGTTSVKTAELAALFAIQRNDVNAAFADEVAEFCEQARIDYFAITALVGTENDSPHNSTLAGATSKEEPYLLLTDAENMNLKLRTIEVARIVNQQIVRHVTDLIKDALASSEKTLRRGRVTLLGLSDVSNRKGRPKRLVKELALALAAKGSRVNLYDPYLSEEDLLDPQLRLKKSLSEAVEGSDCVVIASNHDQFKRLNLKKLKIMMRRPGAIVDLEAVVEPDKVEKEGLIYRGLGRGIWTK